MNHSSCSMLPSLLSTRACIFHLYSFTFFLSSLIRDDDHSFRSRIQPFNSTEHSERCWTISGIACCTLWAVQLSWTDSSLCFFFGGFNEFQAMLVCYGCWHKDTTYHCDATLTILSVSLSSSCLFLQCMWTLHKLRFYINQPDAVPLTYFDATSPASLMPAITCRWPTTSLLAILHNLSTAWLSSEA